MSPLLKRLVLWGGCAYCALLAVSFGIGTMVSRSKAEAVLDTAAEQVDLTLAEGADNIIEFIGTAIVRGYSSPAEATQAQVDRYKQVFDLDELSFIDEKGRFLVSSDRLIVPGSDFGLNATNRLRDYSVLLKGEHCVVEPARGSVERPDLRRKYGGIAFPENKGFVQVGLDERRLLYDFDYFYDNIAEGWHFGVHGFYVIADPATGRIISACHPSDKNKILTTEIPGLLFSDRTGSKTKELMAFGEYSFVRDKVASGHRVLTILPVRDIMGTRDLIVLMTAVVLAIVLLVCFYVFRQVEIRNAAEKAQTEKDLMMAKNIQQNALPSVFPPYPKLVDRLDVYASMHTAKEVGGDFYDFYFVGPQQLAVLVADVSGKGVPAAMFMMRAKTTLQGLLRGGGDVAQLVTQVNERLSAGNEANMFVTAWIGIVNLDTGLVEYVNAGHNPPLVKTAAGELSWMKERSGPPLASFDGIVYKKRQFRLRPGDGLFLYTDGVTEATNSSLELFGEQRLFSCLERNWSSQQDAHTVGMAVVDDLRSFVAGAEQADDITMLAFRLKAIERSFPATDAGMREAQPFLEMFEESPKPAIILDEIVSNIVRCSEAHSFTLRFAMAEKGRLEMRFTDDGKAFDPTAQIAEPDLTASAEDRKIGGLGMFMVRKMSQSVAYRRTETGLNELTVIV